MTSDSPRGESYDAVVVGSGPNGLAAAITLAEAGRSVLVIEAADSIGGGTRSAELTLPGFVHDVCSAIHPFAIASPLLRRLPLEQHGLEWIHPDAPLAHPLDGGVAVVAERSLEETAEQLGADASTYRRLLQPLVGAADILFEETLAPPRLPRHPVLLARFGLKALRSARGFVRRFREQKAPALFAGLAAHSTLPLEQPLSAAVGLMLNLTAHAGGWPFPRGGAQQIALAMSKYLQSLGGQLITGRTIENLQQLPPARAILFDTIPRNLARIAGDALPCAYRRKLERFRHGPGVFKLDWALAGPIPWSAAACRRAGTVHLGGTFDEVAAAERAAWSSQPAERPFVLLAQQSLFDSTRAPPEQHTAWAYSHVPHGCTQDMTERIESQVERFAPGFRDLILARHVMTPAGFQQYNQNYFGGDISGGVMDLWQMLARPTLRLRPYATPARQIFLCSSSTPPGPGVHGMCGYWAAKTALDTVLRDSC